MTTASNSAGPAKLVVPADIDRVPRLVKLSLRFLGERANLSTARNMRDPRIYLVSNNDPGRCVRTVINLFRQLMTEGDDLE